MITVERSDFVSAPVAHTGACHTALFGDPDGNALMLHRRCAHRED